MLSPEQNRYPLLLTLAIGCCLLFAASAQAQYKIELQTCEDLKITEKRYGAAVVETAACVNPIKTFQPKGTLRNVHVVATFPAVPTGAGITFMVTKDDAGGEYVQNIDMPSRRNTRRPTRN